MALQVSASRWQVAPGDGCREGAYDPILLEGTRQSAKGTTSRGRATSRSRSVRWSKTFSNYAYDYLTQLPVSEPIGEETALCGSNIVKGFLGHSTIPDKPSLSLKVSTWDHGRPIASVSQDSRHHACDLPEEPKGAIADRLSRILD